MTTPSRAYLCPKCSSPSMTTPVLAGGNYKCEACGWEGEDPFLIPFGNPYGSADSTFEAFVQEFLKEFAAVGALPLGRILVKWGFVPRDHQGKPNVAILSRLIKSMADGMIKSLLETCKQMEVEKVNGRAG